MGSISYMKARNCGAVKKVPKTDKDLICWDLCFVLGKIFYFWVQQTKASKGQSLILCKPQIWLQNDNII